MNTSPIAALDAAVERFRSRFGLPGSVLKIIAIVTMLIDHTGASVVLKLARHMNTYHTVHAQQVTDLYYLMRRIGRFAFPIFCFLLVEGFLHTHDVKKYLSRMLVFALLSEIPYDWALNHPGFTHQNVYWTLLIGLLVLWCVSMYEGAIPVQLAIMAGGMLLASAMKTDYSYKGVFLIELLYVLKSTRIFQCLCGGAFVLYENWPTPFAFLPVLLYNGKRGRQMKYFFYAFYPGHLIVLGVINNLILPNYIQYIK